MARDPELDELLGAYAIHAVEPDDAVRLDAYVAAEPDARAELDRLRDTAAALGGGLTVGSAPPALPWERLQRELFGGDTPAAAVVGLTGRAAPVLPARAPQRTPRRWRPALAGVVAAAALALVAVGVVAAQRGNGQPTVAELAASAASEPGARTGLLEGPAGQVRVVLGEGGSGYLVDGTLAPLAEGQSYQLWTVDGEVPVSLGVLGRNPTEVAFTAPAGATTLAISVEPSGGSAAPSATPVAAGTLT
jgi:anti-sigma-K factor RskA